MISLDVQGQIFKTDYDTIIKIPYFKNMFEQCGKPEETIPLNRPAHIFKHVLALMCDPFYQYPKKYISELDFYDIDLKGIKFYESDKSILTEIQNTKIMIEQLGNKVKEITYDKPKYSNPFLNPPIKEPKPWGPPKFFDDPFNCGPNNNHDPFQIPPNPW